MSSRAHLLSTPSRRARGYDDSFLSVSGPSAPSRAANIPDDMGYNSVADVAPLLSGAATIAVTATDTVSTKVSRVLSIALLGVFGYYVYKWYLVHQDSIKMVIQGWMGGKKSAASQNNNTDNADDLNNDTASLSGADTPPPAGSAPPTQNNDALGQALEEPIPTQTRTRMAALDKALEHAAGEAENDEFQVQPTIAPSQIHGGGKAGWCLVGDGGPGMAICAEIGSSDICMSGKAYLSQEICMDPTLRP